jgi:hypothetical protein
MHNLMQRLSYYLTEKTSIYITKTHSLGKFQAFILRNTRNA